MPWSFIQHPVILILRQGIFYLKLARLFSDRILLNRYKQAKAESVLRTSFLALEQMLLNYPDRIEDNIRLEGVIKLLRTEETSLEDWAAAFKQAGFGLESELQAAIDFQLQRKKVFSEHVNSVLQPQGGLTRNDVYVLQGEQKTLVVKHIADTQALRHELAAREMSEILGLPTLKTTVGHLESVEAPSNIEIKTALKVGEVDPDAPGVIQRYVETPQHIRANIRREFSAKGDSSNVVLIQEFSDGQTAQRYFQACVNPQQTAYNSALQTRGQEIMQRGRLIEKLRYIHKVNTDLPSILQDESVKVDASLDYEAQSSLNVLKNIDPTSYQLAVVKTFILGDLDNNLGNIILKEVPSTSMYEVCLIDFEEIMPESNIERDRPLPIAVSGSQTVKTGEIRDLKFEYKTLEGGVPFYSGLIALSQATKPFSRDVLQRLLVSLNLEAIGRYHKATAQRNGFNDKQILAQKDRIEYLRTQCAKQLAQKEITLTPREIYDYFYDQNIAAKKAKERFETDFFRYIMIGRASKPLAQDKGRLAKKSRQLTHNVKRKQSEAIQKQQSELDLSIPTDLSNPRAAEIVVGMELLDQQILEVALTQCSALNDFLGVPQPSI